MRLEGLKCFATHTTHSLLTLKCSVSSISTACKKPFAVILTVDKALHIVHQPVLLIMGHYHKFYFIDGTSVTTVKLLT